MQQIKGISASKGIVIGKILRARRSYTGLNRKVRTPDYERSLVQTAAKQAQAQLQELMDKATSKDDADIFLFQQLMLNDRGLLDEINGYISAGAGAAASVERAADIFSARIRSIDDAYMRERACDVQDACRRLVEILDGGAGTGLVLDEPCILAGTEIYPSDILGVERSMLLGFVSAQGSPNAHVAILARTFGIPAVVMAGPEFLQTCHGHMAVLDGNSGKLLIDPTASTLLTYHKKLDASEHERRALQSMIGKPTVTHDGKKIRVYANTGHLEDVQAAFENDAEAVGLFRSEFMYMESKNFPTEEELFATYKAAVLAAGGHRVAIRTLDLGSDKSAAYFKIPVEDNPSLGYRAIRICLRQPDIFVTQLRALLRASAYGEMSIILPMITDVQQVLEAQRHLAEVRAALAAEDVPMAENIQLGIMIETPAAAIASDLLAQIPGVSYFSIGTNDLTQYTLAVDRANGLIGDMYNPRNVSVLRMIKMTVDNAHRHGLQVGICGESAGDHALTALFLALGVDVLSVTPSAVLALRKHIRSLHEADCEKALQLLSE